ncbi:hypothetical protein C5167_014190 [Papaver somniferum]|uniref:NAB domain-containing protein n=1 Tax=Papaver somniferum TaxID=3469 RepID=A0A4Y7J6J1_PAPSO|nr:protein NETWORKED 4B-like [Papaver somniferum]XP_026456461.1 protein NETWORKED 4B-like [Papaver somniferum]XP_026456462.1 protein NETWORKED 4B-like [Papaver somniferum]RZC55339.1 hypothetical protein C5167_014190 [Papaver somniferum]
MDVVLKGHASYSPRNDKRALCLFVMVWIVYSRFHAVGSFFDTYPHYSSSYDWSSCWSTLGAIVMSSKTMKRLESEKTLSWWFGDPKTNNWETSLVLELQNQIARLRLELENNKCYKGVTSDALELISDVSDLASMVKKGMEEQGRVRSEKHRMSEEEVAKLKLELDGTKSSLKALEDQTTLLNEQNKTLEENIYKRDTEIKELKVAISDAKLKFRNEKAQLHKVILALEQRQGVLETNLKNSESEVRKLVKVHRRLEDEHREFRVLQRNHVAEMERHRLSEEEVAKLKLELDATKSSLKEEAAKLELELDATKSSLKAFEVQTALLKEQNKTLGVYISKRDMEIKELKVAISNAELKFRNEKSQLQKVILALEEGQEELKTKLKNSESEVCKLVEEYKRAEGEHNEFRVLQRDREAEMRGEMEKHLKAKMVEKGKELEELSKNLDELKSNFDTLRAERDELDAKVTSLTTEVVSRDEMICHMEEHLHRLHKEHVDIIWRCEGATKQAEEQNKRLRRIEREVEWQRDMIAEGAEEKKEAIRQLCFSLEHYRNRYYEFRNAFIELTKQAPVQDIAYYYRK